MRIFLRIVAPVVLGVLVLAGCTTSIPAIVGQTTISESTIEQTAPDEVVTLEVAEDFTRFVFDPDIVHEEGYPAHGNPFITQGYIYPEGTLDGTNGVNEDGSPEFPEKVLGTWTCRGWILGDMMSDDGTPSAISTQVFELDEAHGNYTLVTDGYEYMTPGAEFTRAITGGSGEYRAARGEQIQEVLGISDKMGMSYRFELRLER